MTNSIIKMLEENIEALRGADLHIHGDDTTLTIRHKDRDYGRLLAYEEMFTILKSEDKYVDCNDEYFESISDEQREAYGEGIFY